CPFKLGFRRPGKSTVVKEERESIIEADSFIVVADRAVILLLCGPRASAAMDGQCVLGIQPYGLIEFLDRPVGFALCGPGAAAVEVGSAIRSRARMELDHLPEQQNRLVIVLVIP